MSHSNEQILSVIIALVLIGFFFFVLIRTYWLWHRQQSPGAEISHHKPTLFDVRQLLLRGEKGKATHIYRKIFKTDLKTAQAAIDDLEKSLHQPGG